LADGVIGMQALIITEQPELRALLGAAAKAAGFAPTAIAENAAAENAFAEQHHALVIFIWKTNHDALELVRQLREHDPRQRSIFLVGTDRLATRDLQSVLSAGADDYVLLPIEPALLEIRLSIAARRARSRQESARLERELRESIERFELAVSGANDGLWDAHIMGQNWNRPDTSVWYSPRFKELLGYKNAEFPNMLESWSSRLHPDDQERVYEALSAHIDRHQPYDVEYRLHTKSGQYRWYSARGHAIWDEQGQLMRMAGSLRDITQTKAYEQQLAQSESKWRSLVENAPDVILLTDPDGTLKFINRSTEEARQAIGRPAYEYIRQPFWEPAREAFARLRETGEPQRYEVLADREGGGTSWYSTRLGPIYHEGKLESVIVVATDFTQQKITEEQLVRERQLLKRLLELQERERQLTAYEIHDGLVQYLTGGLMHLEAFASAGDTAEGETHVDYLRGVSLLRDALAEARHLISGLRPPILDEQGVVAALEYLANESRVEIPDLEFVNRTHFGRLAAPLEVAIFRITQEGLSNIRRHSGAKRARVELVQHGEWVRLVIRDWGCGFDPEKVHEERFGLQGIRQRARLAGSSATIESAPGRGTTIVVDFPLVRVEQPEETAT
jgi:PAS domain S-box-containing protein